MGKLKDLGTIIGTIFVVGLLLFAAYDYFIENPKRIQQSISGECVSLYPGRYSTLFGRTVILEGKKYVLIKPEGIQFDKSDEVHCEGIPTIPQR